MSLLDDDHDGDNDSDGIMEITNWMRTEPSWEDTP
jgi:hypothetical protein